MKKIIPIDIIKGISGKFCGSNSKENFATNKCSSAYFTFRSPFVLRSFSVRSPFILRSFSVRSPFVLRSSSVHSPFALRSAIEERSKNDRRNIGDSSDARRRCIETLMGIQGKGDPNKNFIFNHLNSNDDFKPSASVPSPPTPSTPAKPNIVNPDPVKPTPSTL